MDIVIQVAGTTYSVDEEATRLNLIILPDNSAVEAEAWQGHNPIGLHAVHPRFEDLAPRSRAILVGGVLARRV